MRGGVISSQQMANLMYIIFRVFFSDCPGSLPGGVVAYHAIRREFIRICGSWAIAWMTFQPCFLAVEMKERMTAKSVAPAMQRKPPEIFCLTFIMRASRSA